MNASLFTAHQTRFFAERNTLLLLYPTLQLTVTRMNTKITKCFAIVAMLTLLSNYSWAQRVLTGNVTDRVGPVAGATVLIKGTATATATDGDGNFSLSTDLESGELIVRILGFSSKTIPFSSQTNLGTIILTTSDSQSLEEVVVVGR